MPIATPLLDLGTARRIAQEHVGEDMNVTACWQRPQNNHPFRFLHEDEDEGSNFYFAVLKKIPTGVGGTRHVAVDRRTGMVREIGTFGE